MVVEEKGYHDNKIIYHLNIDEEANNILMHLSLLKTIKINRVIKGTTLVSAFYIFSLAFYSYLFHISFAWDIFIVKYWICCVRFKCRKITKSIYKRAIINKEKQKMNSERKYVFSKEGVDIDTEIGVTRNDWSSFVSKGRLKIIFI